MKDENKVLCPECLGYRKVLYKNGECPLCEDTKLVEKEEAEEWIAQD